LGNSTSTNTGFSFIRLGDTWWQIQNI
jgi:hypothetical protein